jgi:hypothetical protein
LGISQLGQSAALNKGRASPADNVDPFTREDRRDGEVSPGPISTFGIAC